MKNFLIAVLLVAAAVLHAAEPVRIDGVENSYRISRDLYRSAQPEPAGFTALEQLGVRSVLNLREFHKDTRKARHTKLHLMAYPVAAGEGVWQKTRYPYHETSRHSHDNRPPERNVHHPNAAFHS